MATVTTAPPHPVAPPADVPPLENGDRLTRQEFHRRYEAMPHVKKAELIEGIVHMGSPVSLLHAQPHALLITWLGTYAAQTPGVQFGDNATLLLDNDNEPQPDAFLRILPPAAGARSHVSEDGKYLAGAPELLVEIALTSASRDLGAKRRAFRRNGVQEYLVWRVFDRALDWWELADGDYRPLPPGDDGVLASRVFPGLRLAVPALLANDLRAVLDELLARGVNDPAHREFLVRLAAAAPGT